MKQFIIQCLIVLIICINLCYHSCSLISLKYNFHYTSHKAEVFIGEQSTKCYLLVDLTCRYTWLNILGDFSFELNGWKDVNSIQLEYGGNIYSGQLLEGSLGFQSNEVLLKKFKHFYFRQSQSLYKANGVLGLAYTFPDSKYSLVHQLKKDGLINHLSFSIVQRSKIYFGGIPSEATSDHYYSSCEVIDENRNEGHWSCALSKVILKTKTKTLTYRNRKSRPVTFTLENDRNYAPRSFISLIKSKFYNEEIKAKYIRANKFDGMEQLSSPDDGNIKHGNITFVIGNYSYTVDIDFFWECYDIACDFTLYENPYGDYWMLGVSFYKMFHLHFDYEEKKISFYSQKNVFLYEEKEDFDEIKVILVFNGLILFVGVFSIFWRKKRK